MRRLVAYFIFILVFMGVVACREEPEQPVVKTTFTATGTTVPPSITSQPAPSAIITRDRGTPQPSATASLIPSLTPTPEPTSTPTKTPLPDALLTPGTPSAEVSQYRLVPWTADHADNLGRLMESYTEMMEYYFGSPITEPIYRGQFYYPAIAYREAQLLFPDDPNVGRWQLGEITNEAGSGVNNEERFREIVVDALNAGEVSLQDDELVDWFSIYPSFFTIRVDALPPLSGYESAHILTINFGYDVGGMVALILENENGYASYPVFSNLGNSGAVGMSIYLGDLTNDGWPELVVSAGSQNGSMIYTAVLVYELSQSIPRQLSFEGAGGLTINRVQSVSIVPDANGTARLQIVGGEDFTCFLSYVSGFIWNDQWLEPSDFENTSQLDDFAFCLDMLDPDGYWWSEFSDIEREANLNFFEAEFDESQPPEKDSMGGEAYPADYEDEARYFLAMNHAVLGHVAEAQRYLRLILDDPAVPESSWVEPAERFLTDYQGVEDTYRVCLVAGHCDTTLALEQTVGALPSSDYGDIIGRLADLGVTVLNSGTFDFDNDESAETWVILRGLPEGPLELWLLAETDEGIAAEFIDDVSTLSPSFSHYTPIQTESFRNEPLYDHVLFTIGTGDVYTFVRRQRDGEPFVTKLIPASTSSSYPPDPLKAEFDEAVDDLFAGDDPAQVAGQLTTVINNPAFTPGSYHYYYQGLAYQMAGDEGNAVAAYLQAWQDCCDEWQFGSESFVTADPYAIMAQAKLEAVD